MKKWILLLVLLGVVTSVAQAIPNPSAWYCTLQGYDFEIRTDEQGNQYGVCVFPDGSECGTWDYYCKCEPNGIGCWLGDFSCDWPCEEMRCKEAGESVLVSKCCEGLDEIYPALIFDANCNNLGMVGWLFLCSDCGNGFCESWESRCNCPEDCALTRIIYVDADANGLNDGSSWADAFNDLQDALSVALPGDEIRVAQGIYKPGPPPPPPAPPPPPNVSVPPPPPLPPPTGDRTATFQLINGVTLKGGYAGFGESDPNARDFELYETILSGDLAGNDVNVNDPRDLLSDPCRVENSCHVVTGSGVDMTAVLDGFTITAGNANSAYPYSCGGGMYNLQGSPILKNCTFSTNSAVWRGGAMAIHGSNAAVTNCTFSENLGGQGGGINNWFGNPTVINCTFSRNSASHGGGMHNTDGSRPTLINCNFSKNSARYNGGGMFSGTDSTAVLTNCTFISNSAGLWGGGIIAYIHDRGMVTITNCTITGNDADWGSGICCLGNTVLTNSIVWNNTGEDIYIRNFPPPSPPPCLSFSTQSPARLTVSYSCPEVILVEEDAILILGDGNIDADPCFVEPAYWDANGLWIDGNYHLLGGSPCIDAGDPNYIAEPNETDLDGKPRVINGRIDMGAYEYIPPIPAEVDIDPNTLNLKSKGKWITAFIRLPEDYNVADIDPNTIFLQGEIKPQIFWISEDNQVAIAKFSREDVQAILIVGEVELTITGQLTDGSLFEATDSIKVIDKGGKENKAAIKTRK